MKINDILQKITQYAQSLSQWFNPRNSSAQNTQMLSPIPSPSPSPSPTPPPQLWRNPRMPEFIEKNPKSFDEILSGVQRATDDLIRRQILMDISLEESGLNTQATSSSSTASGPFQYLQGTAKQMGIDPFSATESARATNEALNHRNLHWWEVYNKPGATQTPLTDLYTPEELNPYLRNNRQIR